MNIFIRLALTLILLLPYGKQAIAQSKPELSAKAQAFAKRLGKNERVIREYKTHDGPHLVLFSSGVFEDPSPEQLEPDAGGSLVGGVTFSLLNTANDSVAEIGVIPLDAGHFDHHPTAEKHGRIVFDEAVEEALTTRYCTTTHRAVALYYAPHGKFGTTSLWYSGEDSVLNSTIGDASLYFDTVVEGARPSINYPIDVNGIQYPIYWNEQFMYIHKFTLADGIEYYQIREYKGKDVVYGNETINSYTLRVALPASLMRSKEIKDFETAYILESKLNNNRTDTPSEEDLRKEYHELREAYLKDKNTPKGKPLVGEPKLPWRKLVWKPFSERKKWTLKDYAVEHDKIYGSGEDPL